MSPANKLTLPKLPNTWCDKDQILLHACFELLTRFVEDEEPKREKDYIEELTELTDDSHEAKVENLKAWASASKEIFELYEWWKSYDHKSADVGDLEKEDEMLHRLIEIRGFLWT